MKFIYFFIGLAASTGFLFGSTQQALALNTNEAYDPGLSRFEAYYSFRAAATTVHSLSALVGYGHSDRVNPYLGVRSIFYSGGSKTAVTIGNISTLIDGDWAIDALPSLTTDFNNTAAAIGFEISKSGSLMPYTRQYATYNLSASDVNFQSVFGISLTPGGSEEYLIEVSKLWITGFNPKFALGFNKNISKSFELIVEIYHQVDIGFLLGGSFTL